MTSLGDLADALAEDPEIRAIVLTGEGDRAFCAGADLKERKGLSLDDTRALLDLYRGVADRWDAMPKPVIAAINGAAFGGGLELALACDFRIAAAEVTLGLTEVSLGIIPGAGGTQRLTRLVGEARAKELILFAERFSSERALALGVVHAVHPREALADEALAFASRLAEKAPVAITAALEAIDHAADGPLSAGLDRERACYERALVTEDRNEALRAFAEKRPPRFEGR